VADLRARRQELARDALRQTILAGGLDGYRGIVESLAEEFDVMDVAAAAVKQADTQQEVADEDEIPVLTAPGEPAARPGRPAPAGSRGPRDADMTRLFIAGGRALRFTPADLVGVIANQAGLSGRAIGAIHIAERHATVEVPSAMADEVVAALSATTIRGKRIKVERDRFA
jgi:ATP-dependent RNA helicase DeaD